MEHILVMGEFFISLNTRIFEDNINYPVNTTMEVKVQSEGFCGRGDMDIDVNKLA